MQLKDAEDVLHEAEASTKHSQKILSEMHELLAARAEKEGELVGLVHDVGTAMPAAFHLGEPKNRTLANHSASPGMQITGAHTNSEIIKLAEFDKLKQENSELIEAQKVLVANLDAATASAEKFASMVQQNKVVAGQMTAGMVNHPAPHEVSRSNIVVVCVWSYQRPQDQTGVTYSTRTCRKSLNTRSQVKRVCVYVCV